MNSLLPAEPVSRESGEKLELGDTLEYRLGLGDEIYCRGVFGWTGSAVIGNPQNKRKIPVDLIDFYDENCGTDVFFSPNEFFDWRSYNQVAYLRANYIDIDTSDHGVLDANQCDELLAEVLKAVREANVPTPTGYVLSGSGGVHLYWVYEPVEAFRWRRSLWGLITKTLIARIKSGTTYKIDSGASLKPSGVLRLPNSFHRESGRRATSHLIGRGAHYTFDELARSVGHDPNQGLLKFKQPTTKTPPKKPYQGGNHLAQRWAHIYFHVVSHIRAHGVVVGDASKKGNRDLYALILYVALRHMHADESDAWAAMVKLNDDLIGLSESQLDRYLSSAREKGYKYSTDKLVTFFSNKLLVGADGVYLDPGFVYELKGKRERLPPEEVKLRQSASAHSTNTTQVDNTLQRLNDAIQTAHEQGLPLTRSTLISLSGRSESTVKRYWSKLNFSTKPKGVKRCPLNIPHEGSSLFGSQGVFVKGEEVEKKETKNEKEKVIESATALKSVSSYSSLKNQFSSGEGPCQRDVGEVCHQTMLARNAVGNTVADERLARENETALSSNASGGGGEAGRLKEECVIAGEEGRETVRKHLTEMRQALRVRGKTLPDP